MVGLLQTSRAWIYTLKSYNPVVQTIQSLNHIFLVKPNRCKRTKPHEMSKTPLPLPPSLLFFLLVSLPLIVISQSTEQSILLKIKAQWGNPPSIQSWNSSSSPCDWPGINCTNGMVTGLSLLDVNITERIPEAVCELPSLAELHLAWNYIPGEFPKFLYNCSNLEVYLNLFNGSVPWEIGNLSNLEIFEMPYNGNLAAASIPTEFGNLKKLKCLWMTDTNLIGEIPESFSGLSNLENLNLARNNLEGKIPGGLFLLKNLSELFLFNNKFPGEILPAVEASNLSQIDLSMNNLSGSIPQDFGKIKILGLIPTMRVFQVFKNMLNGTLPSELGLHSKLEAFDVFGNQLSGSLPEQLCSGGVLQRAVTFSNNLTGELPKGLGNCDSLRTLKVYHNRFSGEVPFGVWTGLTLSSLMLSDNLFSGQLPASKLAWNLSRLEISNNRFSGEIPVQASGNLFSGKIPVELTSLSQLNTLLLDGNQFSGELPSQIISWESLNTLNLSRNALSSHIPAAIGSLPNLLYLDLSGNQFTGEIPAEIGSLRLSSLNLSSNKLSGKIPDVFDNLAYENSFLNISNLCANSPVLNLPGCYTKVRVSHKLSSKVLAMILVLSIAVFLVTVLLTFFVVRDYWRRKRGQDLATWKLTSFHRLNLTEFNVLASLTDTNLIGSGGSGNVYQVSTNCPGEHVTVKRICNTNRLDERLEKEFIAEVEILGTIRRSNIVKLWCCISSDNSKLLVHEYMANQSLDKWLHGKRRRPASGLGVANHTVLDWPTRLQITIGAAQGLYYVHHDCSPPIIHRDVKSSNILLDSEFKARIADFRLAKIFSKDGNHHTMSAIAGSFGYMAPEYSYTTKINEKIDVYSFGVVLLELTTGREPNCGDEHTGLAEWAWREYSEGKTITDALDGQIAKPCYLEEMATVLKLGLICTSTLPSTRPSMKEVLHILLGHGPSNGFEVGQVGSDFDVSPLLSTATCLSSYKRSKEVDDSLVYSV
ncbi:receptor-like protein kinase HSL1 [Pyrus ussuriensis x Pyrus communis]|uniref:Receptor-like protein kinase HSL1 n=1 Tax=Pyrus ussuriensis x Pyrus communis TaxID=2448454 RepID=A0A5N5HPD5_9ROSA|nr:receptor-like protein kinase HSL1 [Pyrus ussuriensis x Pyrus communis]